MASILAVSAHPDDETLFAGGTLAMYAEKGHRVFILETTRGQGGEVGEPPLTTRENLAAFRELEAFAQLGTELDPATQSRLDRGYRMVELLKQNQYKPMDVVDQVLVIYAGTHGHLDSVPIADVHQWEEDFLRFLRDQRAELREQASCRTETSARPVRRSWLRGNRG